MKGVKMDKRIGITIGILVLILLAFLLKPYEIVDSGNRGLIFTWGKLKDTVLDEGMNFKLPLVQSIKEITIRPIELKYDIAVGTTGAITKDNQNIGINMVLFYRYKAEDLVTLWRDVGLDTLKNINIAALKTSAKNEIGKYTIFDIAPIQEQIRQNIFSDLVLRLKDYPEYITELKITNYDWPDSFEQQIEETMKKAQEVKQKEQDLLIAEQVAQKQVKQAEAIKQAQITEAEGNLASAKLNTEAKKAEGEGIRQYNESIAKNMALEIEFRKLEIDKIKASRWNGQYVPNNMYGPIPVSTGGVQK